LTATFGILAALCGLFAGLAAHSNARIAVWAVFFVFWAGSLILLNRR
jgi:hypothetical protein